MEERRNDGGDPQEREKLKEEKKKYAQRLKLLSKPREDMECEDLKVSECTIPTRSRDRKLGQITPFHTQSKSDFYSFHIMNRS